MKRNASKEFIEPNLKIALPIYLADYRKHVESIYKEEYSEAGSKIFKFMQPVKAIVLMHDKDTHILFYNNHVDEISFKDCSHIPFEELDVINSTDSKFKRIFITDILNLDTKYVSSINLNNFIEYGAIGLMQPHFESIASDSGVAMANDHYNDYEFVKAFEKAIVPSNKTNVVDTELILNKVKDPSFQYEFEESIKAYNVGLYLAAAATGGIALENILRILIRRKTDAALPKDTYIKDSLAVLKRNHILSNRLAASVNSLRDIRNSNSHTNEDPVRKTTVDHLYATIEDLAMLL